MSHKAWIQKGMARRRMTQRALGVYSGVDHSTISRILQEDRSPSMSTIVAMQRVLGGCPICPGDAPCNKGGGV